jgi:hypothetical protein
VVTDALVYVDVSDVRQGALEELKQAIADLSDFVEANEPELVSYDVYFNDDGTQMSVVHVHAHPASLDRHLEIAGVHFGRFADLVTLKSIHLYGRPSESAVEQLREKLRLLGLGDVVVHPPHVGFIRGVRS